MKLFSSIPASVPDELIEVSLAVASLRIERIVSHGHASPPGSWNDQDQHEWVIVLKGAARLRFEDGIVEMKPGDFLNIPAHQSIEANGHRWRPRSWKGSLRRGTR